MKMSLKLSEEQISSCRRGSDIDIEAIFGGHISGKRSPDVRVNPVFIDKHKSEGHGPGELDSENNNISNDENSNIEIIADQNTENQSESPDLSSDISMVSKGDSQKSSRSERESLKVTNGNVLVGDIVIENGYKNPGFEGDVVTESANQRTTDRTSSDRVRKRSSVNSMVHFFDNKATDSKLIISQNNNNESDWPDLDDITLTVAQKADPNKDTCNHDNSDPGEKSMDTSLPNGDVNHNTFQGDDKKNSNKVDENVHSESKEIGKVSLENGVLGSKSSVVKGKENSKETTQVSESEVKAVKKIKERKNSVPEHIQNCTSMDRPKGIKPILVSGTSVEEAEPTGEQSEHKSVKFSDDTVFNDGRPNKYRRDTKTVNLREIYKGKVNSDFALAKPNPMFLDDSGLENSLTDDEKVARNWGQVKGYVALPTCLKDNTTPKQETNDNKDVETDKSDEAVDIESIETEEKPRYDRLIKRTIARQRRSKLIRLVFAFLAFLVVIAAVVLLVIYFGKS